MFLNVAAAKPFAAGPTPLSARALRSNDRPSWRTHLTDEYLAEPDEADKAADMHLSQFLREGHPDGEPIDLVVNVSGIPAENVAAVETRVRELFHLSRLEHRKAGLFRKPSFRAYLLPMPLDRSSMLSCSTALYRLIIEQQVTVLLEKA